jgi:hypothetical protein
MSIDSKINVSMDNISADVEVNDDTVVEINDQIDSVNHPDEHGCIIVRIFPFRYQ